MTATQITENKVSFEGISFDPQLVLIDSAQVFHWQAVSSGFSGSAGGHAVILTPQQNGFVLEGCPSADIPFWTDYFDLNRDYDSLISSCRDYPLAVQAISLLPGMRILHQPVWEALISFIVSANNNVGRIRKIILALIEHYGENGAFPSPDVLAHCDEAALRELGCGYRAPYLIRTARMTAEGNGLSRLQSMNYEEAHKELMKYPGVGDKVADCVQLFGLAQSRAFPVDVWVERLMKAWFIPDAASKRQIREAAYQMFGENAGLIQQSLFHCARLGLIEL